MFAAKNQRILMAASAVLLYVASATSVLASGVAPASPPSLPIARNLGDVVKSSASSFALVGGISFLWSASTAMIKRAPGPVALGWQSAQRWGKVSAGFAGGQALGQVFRGVDDKWCSMSGAVFGGAAAGEWHRKYIQTLTLSRLEAALYRY